MADVKKLDLKEIKDHLEEHDEWFLTDEDDKIVTALEFDSFSEAAEFTAMLAKLSDDLGHHPEVYIYDQKFMQVLISTHEVDGFSQKDLDFIHAFDEMMAGEAESEEDIESDDE